MKALVLKIIRGFQQPKETTWLTWVSRLIKVAITAGAILYIYFRLKGEGASVWETFLSLTASEGMWVLMAFLLIPVNLGFEAAKWRLMIRRFYPNLSFSHAYQAILSGITTGIFTPNGVGAYAGRVLFLDSGKRVEAAVGTFLDRIVLMLITLWVGTLSFEFLLASHGETIAGLLNVSISGLQPFRWLMLFLSTVALLGVIFPHTLHRIWTALPTKGVILSRVTVALADLDRTLLLRVTALAVCRYLTFTGQYYVLLLAFGYEGSFLLAIGMVWAIFFVKSVIPSISLTELGIRESIAIALMGAFAVPAVTAFTATFVLYVFNIILPALVGLVFVHKLKFDWKL